MYKVFVNDTPIIITQSSKIESIFPVYAFKEISFDEILDKLKDNSIKGITLYSTDLEKDWQAFTKNLKVVPAAGGLVLNDKKEILFIYRNNVWDLPKGWIEKDESIESAAIREVEEECAIFELSIIKKLITTYHIYHQNGFILKETHWYLMHSNYNAPLKPQLEEGITAVCFKSDAEINETLQNTYANIKLVYNTFKEA
ncbi:NUDIX hydrolase [Polaribacter reichenbachii]|uniref:NUDIX hydrolase n=1 Tax=Polaribacter reichenbachii TaxID=996801 RepID=A0A1B8U526_9FLAO|nr:NUDIX domain-containing protein [Polaribacter reichenbachii]APZ48002.1 NUDIX hydrolase [Polaribacter reichenbachii]AUC20476.1 NUDIX hydrolase [Polaribacter reichenbachii]OBY66960.1 NUDIX hydrolase [Polaribacter reichenbachii]